jgi:hypothetical protein
MNRQLASALAVVCATAALALAAGTAYADDITLENSPFVGSRTRAEVQAELLGHAAAVRTAAGEWAMQDNDPVRIKSAYTSAEAKAEFKTSRPLVSALNGEDSGSAYFLKSGVPYLAKPGSVMGAPPAETHTDQ